jgi:protein ImuB
MRPPRDTEIERAFPSPEEREAGVRALPIQGESPRAHHAAASTRETRDANGAVSSELKERSDRPTQQPAPDDETRARWEPQAASAQAGTCSMHNAARSEPESSKASEVKEERRTPKSQRSTRVACLYLPALSLSAELRADPELRGRALAIASAPGPRGEVIACSPEAARAGVRVGSGVVHARAACAQLVVRVLSPARERAAREALLDAALACAPRAELAPPGAGFHAAEAAVFVDARGVASLYRSEAGFASALAARAEKLGLPAHVAVANTRGTALIAARLLAANAMREERSGAPIQQPTPDDETRARWERQAAGAKAGTSPMRNAARSEPESAEASEAQGKESTKAALLVSDDQAFLAPLSLDLLPSDDLLADALSRFGLRRVGDLLRVPERALVNRLGPALLPLLALARGEDVAAPPRAPDAALFEEGSDLEAPVAQLEPLLFVLRGLLARLADRLASRGLAFGEIGLALALDGGGRDERSLGLAAPTRDVRVLLRIAALALEATPPRAAVLAISVTTRGAERRGDQLDFFAPAGPAPGALSRTLAELAALCGPERVGAPALANAHRPDAFALTPFVLVRGERKARGASSAERQRPALRAGRAPPEPNAHASIESAATSQRSEPRTGANLVAPHAPAVRALRPPLAASVRSARGAPQWVQSALANGEVLRCAGPWRTTGQWWSEERYAFDHYDVATDDGAVFRLRRDLLHERWEIDGVFD